MVFPDESESNIGQEFRTRVHSNNNNAQQTPDASNTRGPISERELLSARRLLLDHGAVLSKNDLMINDGMDQYKNTIPILPTNKE
jgi:hypothetical protein